MNSNNKKINNNRGVIADADIDGVHNIHSFSNINRLELVLVRSHIVTHIESKLLGNKE